MIPLKDDNPTRTTPFITLTLILANIVVFAYEILLPPETSQALIYQLGLIPAEVTTGVRFQPDFPLPLTVFTSMFLHGGWLHLGFNMLFLWTFGNNIEDAAGHLRFLVFYLLCGIGAAGTQVFASPDSEIPMIGASGAIGGILGAYMLLYPRARVLTLVPIFIFLRLMYIPAVVFLGLWFGFQILMSSIDQADAGGVAFFAHIGGFVAGMLLIWFFRKTRRPRPGPLLDDL
jgi:membrane associated rhomboid family serine protease